MSRRFSGPQVSRALFAHTFIANLCVMVTLNEVHPLSDFQKNANGHLRRLSKTGQPEVLTVDGKPAVVVQDARSYQRLLDSVEQAEAIAGIKFGLESLARGEGVPAKRVFARLRRKHKIPARE